MSALALLSEFSRRGIRVKPNGENVSVTPKQALTTELLNRIKREKPALIRELDRIRDKAGDDWEEISGDPKQLKDFYELLMITEMRSRGTVPEHYTATTECRRCGPVPIFEGLPPQVMGCPWCFNRRKGLPIPRAKE